MRRVTGIGGIFFSAKDPKALRDWYKKHLGIDVQPWGGAVLKAILSVALVLALCGLARAQGEKADPVGTWKCEYGIEGQKRTSTLTLKMDGDKLAGTMSWPDQKETPLLDVKLKDGTLTFDAKRVLMGKEFANHYELKIDGDKLKGKLTSDLQGKKGVFDLEATRQKNDQ